jgi:hypothetical protein
MILYGSGPSTRHNSDDIHIMITRTSIIEVIMEH